VHCELLIQGCLAQQLLNVATNPGSVVVVVVVPALGLPLHPELYATKTFYLFCHSFHTLLLSQLIN
jgi:hypothetical protein